MDRTLARIELQRGIAYYKRVVRQAAHEALHPWGSRLGTSAAIAVLTFIFAWIITGTGLLTALAVTATKCARRSTRVRIPSRAAAFANYC